MAVVTSGYMSTFQPQDARHGVVNVLDGIGAHRWRHLHAVKALEAGRDIFTLSRQLGHADISVTTNYLRVVSARQLRRLTVSPLDVLDA